MYAKILQKSSVQGGCFSSTPILQGDFVRKGLFFGSVAPLYFQLLAGL